MCCCFPATVRLAEARPLASLGFRRPKGMQGLPHHITHILEPMQNVSAAINLLPDENVIVLITNRKTTSADCQEHEDGEVVPLE